MPPVFGTSAQHIRILNPWFLEQDNNGRPAAGYKVYTLQAGSVATLVDTYSDKDLTSPNTNPIILNLRGEANIFTSDAFPIKLVFTAPTGDLSSPIWTEDYVTEASGAIVAEGPALGTTNNIYHVNTTPAYSIVPDGLSLVMIPDVANQDTLITRTFVGTGINDPVFTGPYVGLSSSIFTVQIDATPGGASPDTFKWRKDGGAWTTGVSITTSRQVLQEGLAVTFSEIQGHVLNDYWTMSVRPPAYLDFCGLGPQIIYKSADGALEALAGNDIIAGIPAHLDYSASQSCWILLNPSQPVLSSQVPGRRRKEIIAAYAVNADDDWGNELSCDGTFTVTLPACINAVNRFYYILNSGTGVITIEVAGGTDLIVLPGVPTGVQSFELRDTSWLCVQLVTNGANWHMTTETTIPHGFAELDGTAWVCPMWVTKVKATGIGGGGGGGANVGEGGRAGVWVLKEELTVVPGTSYINTIGSGGAAGAAGTDTVFGALLTLTGGAAGADAVGTASNGENSLFGKGGPKGSGGAGGDGVGRGSGGGGGDAGITGGAGVQGRLFLEW